MIARCILLIPSDKFWIFHGPSPEHLLFQPSPWVYRDILWISVCTNVVDTQIKKNVGQKRLQTLQRRDGLKTWNHRNGQQRLSGGISLHSKVLSGTLWKPLPGITTNQRLHLLLFLCDLSNQTQLGCSAKMLKEHLQNNPYPTLLLSKYLSNNNKRKKTGLRLFKNQLDGKLLYVAKS